MIGARTLRWVWAAGLAPMLALAAGARPQGAAVAGSEIDLAEPVSSVLFGDVDGDGLKDALLLLGRRVAVHKLRADRTYPPRPDFVVKLDADTVAIDLVPAPKGAGPARAVLLCATAGGLHSRDLDRSDAPSAPWALPPLDGALVPRAAGAAPIAMTLTADLDGDGVPELLLPVADGIAVLRREGDSWRPAGIARAPVDAHVESGEDRPGAVLQQTFELPRVAVVDVKPPGGKPNKMLGVSRGNESWLYRLEEGALVLFEHARALYRLDAEDRFRAVRGSRRNEETNDRAVGLLPVDLNGDGVPDFVSSRFRDGQVFFTIGRPGSFNADAADQVIDADGWVILAQTRDFDGDGRPDLVVPRLPKLGIAGALRVLLSRKISLDLWIFKNTGDSRIVGSTPDWKYTFDVELLIGGDEGKFTASTRLMAGFFDVNGDGLPDFVTSSDRKHLAIYAGNRGKIFSSEPTREVVIPDLEPWPETDLRGCDVDGDGREDLLVIYGPNKKGAKNKLYFAVWQPDKANDKR